MKLKIWKDLTEMHHGPLGILTNSIWGQSITTTVEEAS